MEEIGLVTPTLHMYINLMKHHKYKLFGKVMIHYVSLYINYFKLFSNDQYQFFNITITDFINYDDANEFVRYQKKTCTVLLFLFSAFHDISRLTYI